jgi:hypothetical protein
LQADGGESFWFCCQDMWISPDAALPLTVWDQGSKLQSRSMVMNNNNNNNNNKNGDQRGHTV